ncbi:hypothetical protein F2Q69_00019122 [Brassica cretica]|uniref:Uncharacterized protein n=1 Tax=Brassica cretica TaxID=69181 RepID=A0A8S9Q382_BRACR|nr:hypothetical protein F2Q69_00019122 [Brassica cretica]
MGEKKVIEEKEEAMKSKTSLVFAVNGERFELDLSSNDPSTTLVDFLRNKTPFKSVKLGCGEGKSYLSFFISFQLLFCNNKELLNKRKKNQQNRRKSDKICSLYSDQTSLVFAVNGERFEIDLSSIDPSTTLIDFLRNKTPFKSVKLGCGEGKSYLSFFISFQLLFCNNKELLNKKKEPTKPKEI